MVGLRIMHSVMQLPGMLGAHLGLALPILMMVMVVMMMMVQRVVMTMMMVMMMVKRCKTCRLAASTTAV